MNLAGFLLVCSFIIGSIFLGSGTVIGTAVGLYAGTHNYRQHVGESVEYSELK